MTTRRHCFNFNQDSSEASPQTPFTTEEVAAKTVFNRKTLELLESAIEHGYRDLAALEMESAYPLVRHLPKFQALLQRLREQEAKPASK